MYIHRHESSIPIQIFSTTIQETGTFEIDLILSVYSNVSDVFCICVEVSGGNIQDSIKEYEIGKLSTDINYKYTLELNIILPISIRVYTKHNEAFTITSGDVLIIRKVA